MNSSKYLLIGGGLASSQAAKELRKNDTGGSITLVGEEAYVPYDRPPLSKEFLRGEKTREELLFDPERYFHDHRIALLLGLAVRQLDQIRKTAVLSNNDTITFEKALIATGGRPVRLPVPGADLEGVHYLRTIDDSLAIAAEASHGKRAIVVGGGFIGMEVAASLTQRGVQVTVIEMEKHLWPRFADEKLAGFFQGYCEKKGVVFLTNTRVSEIRGNGRPSSVLTASGQDLPCDFVCIGAGIILNTELAQEAGLTVQNGVLVNEHLESSHPGIYAAGDVANYWDPVFNKRRHVEHWGHAEYCGQLAGRNMTGAHEKYDLLTYVWSDIFDLHLEFAGDESEHDQVLLRGGMEDASFAVLYFKQHALRAYFGINLNAKDLPLLQRLIRQKTILSGKETQIQDPGIPLKSLL
jgi:3-phenylpropionate/trans-cinnamate dioxygenase ferredoxin reductase subunit